MGELAYVYDAKADYLKSMALIHQKLYQRENLAAVEMKDYLQTLGQSLLSTFSIRNDRIRLISEMEELELDVDTAIPIGLIVNELITNSINVVCTAQW